MADLKSFDTSRSDFEPYGFTVELWQPAKVPRLDRHGEIEINYVPKGTITYICGGKRVVVYSRQLIVFWAAIPHQVIGFDQAEPYYVITIPLRQAIDWQLPKHLLNALIHGQVLRESTPFMESELTRFATWQKDFESGSRILIEAMALELRARLLRLFHSLLLPKMTPSEHAISGDPHGTTPSTDPPIAGENVPSSTSPIADSHRKLAAMIQYIAANFQRKLTTEEIASHANLHPDYATMLLRRSIGTTMIDLITCYRVIHSQRLLITTATTISEIARQSGFETLSRYNAAFKQFSGTTPSAYRREMGTFQGESV